MRVQHKKTQENVEKTEEFKHPLVSIIIPTYNSSKTVEKCLKSVKKQTYENIETIVSDNFSTDKTADIARKYKARVVLKGSERAVAKNYGASVARGSLLYFIDSDFVLACDTVQKCVRAITKADALVTSKASVGKSFWARTISYKNQLLADDPSVLAARFMKKDVFFKAGGFHETLVYGEDVDLHRRLLDAGYLIRKVNAIEWHIGEPKTLKEFVLKKCYYGKTLKRYLKRDRRVIYTHLNPFKLELLKGVLKNPSLLIFGLGVIQIVDYIVTLLELTTTGKDSQEIAQIKNMSFFWLL